MTQPAWVEFVLKSLQNKYVAATVLALLWATFIHDLGLPYVVREAYQLAKLKTELSEVEQRNALLQERQARLLTDPVALERFARERYFMRRANEEVYRVVE